MAYIVPNYQEKQMYIVFKDASFPVSNLLSINKVRVASHGTNQSYLLTLEEENLKGVLRTFEIDFTDFNSSQESASKLLNSNGFVICSFKYTNHIREYVADILQQMITKGMVEYYHTNLGYTRMTDDSTKFLLGDTTYKGKESMFMDKKFKFQHGEYKSYEKFLNNEILPYFETRLALTIGLASVISSDLMEYGDVGTIVLNFSGESSTGKTTITQFMASLWGSPKISNTGIVRTFNATSNSLVQTFTGTNGVPIVIDDATSLGIKDLAAFIYNIAAGEDKLRLTSDIEIRESKGSWSGLVTITSETSILENSTKTGGSIPRLLEFDNIIWTQDARHAKVIKRQIARSYGHIGPQFVEHYNCLSVEEKRTMFDSCEDEIEELVSVTDQYTSRIIAKLTIIYMTAKVIDRYFGFPEFTSREIRDYLVEFEHSKVPIRSIEAQALEIIKTFIIRNQHKMAYKRNPRQLMELSSAADFIGYREFINEEIVEITVISQVLSAELIKHNISQ